MRDCYVKAHKSTTNRHEFSKLSILRAFKSLCSKSHIMGASARAHEAAIENIKVVKKVDKILYDLINLRKSDVC